MKLKLTSAPDPLISLTDMKVALRVEAENTAEDRLITRYVASATDLVESYTRLNLISARYTGSITADVSADYGIRLDRYPIQAVTAKIDATDVPCTIEDTGYCALVSVKGVTAGQVISLTVTAGYGDSQDAVPAILAQAVEDTVAYLFENRGLGGLPAQIATMIQPYKRYGV